MTAAPDLRTKLSKLSIPIPTGSTHSRREQALEGKTFHFEANPLKLERLSVHFKGGTPQFTLFDGTTERVLRCGRGKWTETPAPLAEQAKIKAAATGVWIDPDTYQIRVVFYETPFIVTLISKFSDDGVQFHTEANVAPASPVLTGHRV